MIMTRTPFRIPLGGGSTDLKSYYEKHGGFIFSVTINLYMYVGVNRPPIDDLIRLKYHDNETVKSPHELKHRLAKAALLRTGIDRMVEISSKSDVPNGAGLGSSGTYIVGLLNALYSLKGENVSRRQLAEEAYEITNELGLPDGKQDPYAVSFGNFSVFKIDTDGKVEVHNADISRKTQERFEKQALLFYTGVTRTSEDLLNEQHQKIKRNERDALELKHQIKRIGREIHQAFETDDLDTFGYLMDEHWRIKKSMSNKMSNSIFDEVYKKAKKAGAYGGKILGAGGGGFFLIYCPEGAEDFVRKVFEKYKMREVPIRVDSGGTQILVNRPRINNTI